MRRRAGIHSVLGRSVQSGKVLKSHFSQKPHRTQKNTPTRRFTPFCIRHIKYPPKAPIWGCFTARFFRDFAKNFPQRRNNGKFPEKTGGNFFAPTITIRQKWRHMRAAIHLIRQKILRTRAKLLCPPEKRRIFCSPALSSTGQTFQVFGAPQYAGRPPANSP